jgi:hypothetical protein
LSYLFFHKNFERGIGDGDQDEKIHFDRGR